MPREIDEKSIHLLIRTQLSKDFHQLREMLNIAEQICDLAAPQNKQQANRLYDKLIDLARELIKANANRPQENSPPKDSKPNLD